MSEPVPPAGLTALDETTRRQNLAATPALSVWVSANAGSGKTHVLTQRVIRLMLAGTRPSSILCLTYTKAAAAEMSNRVFEKLAHWTALDDTQLAADIDKIEGKSPDRATLAQARKLFARALETPGGLKIQTIHAFCEALLHQFPLEANVAGHFNVLDDKAAASLIAEARRALLTATQGEDDSELAEAFYAVLEVGDESGLNRLLGDIIRQRTGIGRFLAAAQMKGGIEHALANGMGLQQGRTLGAIAADAWPLAGLDDHGVAAYCELANAHGGQKAQETACKLQLAVRETDPERRLDLLRDCFLKQDDTPYAETSFSSKAMRDRDFALCERIINARDELLEVWQEYKTRRALDLTVHALTLAARFIDNYDRLKRERAFLDFEDFITRVEALLRKSDIGPWVHYKLDRGIDHILVDEAQDTSPPQWEIIRSLSEEFFSGEGARQAIRTIFAVGDEKQSIYSFQGARPERFAIERRTASSRAAHAGRAFEAVNLHVSFRSTDDVLTAVDTVFSHPDNARGLSADNELVAHVSARIGHAGAVDIWDEIADPEALDEDEDWLTPFDRPASRSSAVEMARRMAASIQDLVGRQPIMTRQGPRLIRPGDILVLVRKRDAFAGALARELKINDRVPVAGTDRLSLAGHIAVQDLMALGRVLLLEADDLSLAALVKSPLFDLDEERLAELAAHRNAGETLWRRLDVLSRSDPVWSDMYRKLTGWKSLARALRVHDFYALLLGREGGRARFLARFGGEVSDVLDEFLNFALDHESAGLPGLAAFITTLETDSPEIKREQDKGRNEVRIMTVHASKGLEAPVVFLVDSSGRPFDKSLLPKLRLVEQPHAGIELPIWYPSKEFLNPVIAADELRLEAAAEEEYRRLLYVGMTRASDRLILCSYRKKRKVEGTWAKIVTATLQTDEARCRKTTFRAGDLEWEGWQWRQGGSVPDAVPEDKHETVVAEPPPAGPLHLPLSPLPVMPRPLSPSGTHALIDEQAGDRIVTSALFGDSGRSVGSPQRGRIVHRLMQALPDFAPDKRDAAAQRYLTRALPDWSEEDRRALIGPVLHILSEPEFAALHGEGSRAEVSIMGTVRIGDREHAVSGRIDRMGIVDENVFVLDYKTNRAPPVSPIDIPFAHRAQLALYREVLKPLFPDRPIRCLLIYTEGPHLYSLSDAELEKALLELSPE